MRLPTIAFNGHCLIWFVDRGRQLDREDAAFAGLAVDRDVAAHHLTEAARECEAQTGSAELSRRRRICLREGLKEPDDLLGTESDAGVGHAEHDPLAAVHGQSFGQNFDHAVVGEFRCIGNKIEQALTQFAQISVHEADVRRARNLERIAVLHNLHFDCRGNVGDQRRDVESLEVQLHLAGLDLREIEDVVDEDQQVLASSGDFLEIGIEIEEAPLDRVLLQHL